MYGMPGEDECLVCLAKLHQVGVFAHLRWESERATFCSQACLEIFQNSPAAFMRRLKSRAGKIYPVGLPTSDVSHPPPADKSARR